MRYTGLAMWTTEELAARAEIPPAILHAIRQIESSGNPRAVRFEPHVFNRLTEGRYAAQIPFTRDPERGVSLVREETNRDAFGHAFRFDPEAAVRATSWGRYQVLGGHLLSVTAAEPALAVAQFDADPISVGAQMLVSWFQGRPAARRAAQVGDIDTLARLYNGSSRWGNRLRQALSNPRPLEDFVDVAAPKSNLVGLALVFGGVLVSVGYWFWRYR